LRFAFLRYKVFLFRGEECFFSPCPSIFFSLFLLFDGQPLSFFVTEREAASHIIIVLILSSLRFRGFCLLLRPYVFCHQDEPGEVGGLFLHALRLLFDAFLPSANHLAFVFWLPYFQAPRGLFPDGRTLTPKWVYFIVSVLDD